MKKILLFLTTLFVVLSTQALPTDALTGVTATTPKYTYNNATGELTLNWGEYDKYNNWDYDVINTTVKSVTATSDVTALIDYLLTGHW